MIVQGLTGEDLGTEIEEYLDLYFYVLICDEALERDEIKILDIIDDVVVDMKINHETAEKSIRAALEKMKEELLIESQAARQGISV